jgi:hypothetical protein
LGLLLTALAAVPCRAQTAAGPIEVGVGLRWLGATSFPGVSAEETSLGNRRFVLFDTDSRIQPAAGIDARIGFRVTSILHVEGALAYVRPSLQTRVTSDAESIPDSTASETIAQYMVEGGITAQLARWRIGRLMPFASGGGGYLRQLHQGRQLVENGQTYYVGGGFRYPLTTRPRGLVRSSGIRADVRATGFKDGVALDEGTHWVPSLSASFFVTF